MSGSVSHFPFSRPLFAISRAHLLLLGIAAALFLASVTTAHAATATAIWNSNPEPDIAGYKLSYGGASGSYTTTVDVGNVTSYVLQVVTGQSYYFAIQAYNTSGMLSPYSTEIPFTAPLSGAPTLVSLSPTAGNVGTTVAISGSNFGSTQGTSAVKFNGTTASPTSWSGSSIVVPVPAGATTGAVGVTVGAVASNTLTFTVTAAAPILTSLSPTSGTVGTSVTIAGANFGATKGTSTVKFNGTTATPTTWSASSIVVPVPSGATTGNVVVTVGSVASNGLTFTVAAVAPTLTSLSPTSGAVGTAVTLTGTNFGATRGTSTVTFNGTSATPTSWAASSIVVPVPSGAATGNVVVTVNGVASNASFFTVTGATTLPAPWQTQDVGSPAVSGQATTGSGTFSVSGAGTDIWGRSDQFRFVYQTFDGDGQIVARVDSLQNVDAWTKAGVMIRADLTAGAANALAGASTTHGMFFQSRASQGAQSVIGTAANAAPRWVRLVRSGNTLTGYQSADGTGWILISSSSVTLPVHVYVGLAVTSHNASTLATASFSNVTVAGTSSGTASISSLSPGAGPVGTSVTISGSNFGATQGSSALTFNGTPATPMSWSASGIVAPVPTGASTGSVVVTVGGVASNAPTFTVTTAAPTLTSLSPTSGTVGTSVTITGANFGASKGTSTVTFNGTVATPTSWSASGIVAAVPSGTTTGAVVVTVGGMASNALPFTVAAGAPTLTSLSPTSGTVGTAVTLTGTNFGSTQGTSTVTFNGTAATPASWAASSIAVLVPSGATSGNVIVTVNGVASNASLFTVTVGTLPAPWQTQDVGNPAVTGQATEGAGTFSVSGAGADIWGTTDQFRFVYQTLDGDGQIVARVDSVQTIDSWSKAGVMIRTDLTAGAANAMAGASAGHGMIFQSRIGQGAQSSSLSVGGAAPRWVRLVRSGNTLTGYSSSNGAAWTQMSSSVVPMPARAYVGLVVTSHNSSTAATASFSNVTVSAASSTSPSISSLSPTNGAVGTSVTITGANFGATQGTSRVAFNGVAATPTSWAASTIVVKVPSGATTGNVVVTVGSVASNALAFSVAGTNAITFVQLAYATPSSAATVRVPFARAQTPGNLNVVVVGWNDTKRTVRSVTDTAGNVYVRAVGPTALPGSLTQSIYYAKSVVASSTNSVTVTFSSTASFPDIRIAEYSGLDPLDPLDLANGSSGSGGTST